MQETEADTRANRIDPVLRDAGWGVADGSRIAREEIAKGRITAAGRVDRARAIELDINSAAASGGVTTSILNSQRS